MWVDGREPKVLIKQNCSTKSFGSLASHLPAPRPHHSQPVGAALLRLNSLPVYCSTLLASQFYQPTCCFSSEAGNLSSHGHGDHGRELAMVMMVTPDGKQRTLRSVIFMVIIPQTLLVVKLLCNSQRPF